MVRMTNVPPSRGGNELEGVVVSVAANYAPCPVTPRLMQEIEEQNQIVSWFVRLCSTCNLGRETAGSC